jgi:hypothetical protein
MNIEVAGHEYKAETWVLLKSTKNGWHEYLTIREARDLARMLTEGCDRLETEYMPKERTD